GLEASDCARHHPLHAEQQRVPGTPSPSFSQGAGGWAGLHCARPPSTPSASARNESILSARCASTTGSPAAPPLFPVCATREHVRRPGHHMPALECEMREHRGLTKPPARPASAQPLHPPSGSRGLPAFHHPP